jgi:hypothetical protein
LQSTDEQAVKAAYSVRACGGLAHRDGNAAGFAVSTLARLTLQALAAKTIDFASRAF